MTERVIRVVIDPSGSQKGGAVVRKELDGITGAASKVTTGILAAAAAVAGSVYAFAKLSSTWQDLNSRLRIATGGQERANAVMTRLQEIARRNYADITTVTEGYLRNSIALNDMGVATERQVDLQEAISNALTVSGAKAERAASVQNALGKALASGKLAGENFNTVMESGGRVTQALAEGLGVSVLELKAMAKEGQLTSEVVMTALISQLAKLREEADSMPATISDAMVVFKNNTLTMVGRLDDALGITTRVVKGLDAITAQFKAMEPELINFGRALFGALDPMDELSDESRGFASVLVVLGASIGIFANILTTTLAGAFRTVGETLGGLLAAAVFASKGEFQNAWETIKTVFTDQAEDMVKGTADLYDELVLDASDTVEKLVQIWDKGAREVQDRRVAPGGDDPVKSGEKPQPGLTDEELKAMEARVQFLRGMSAELANLTIQTAGMEAAAEAITEFGAAAGAAIDDDTVERLRRYGIQLDASALGNEEFVAQALSLAEAIERQNAAFEDAKAMREDAALIDSLTKELELAMMGNRERAIEIELRRLSAQATSEQIAAVTELAGRTFDLLEAAKQQQDILAEFGKATAQGIQQAFADFLFDPFSEGLDGLARSVANTLHRIAAEMLANAALQQLFGAMAGAGGGGGFWGAIGKAGLAAMGGTGGGLAYGGTANVGQPRMVGEHGREMFVPPTSGRVVPNHQLGTMAAAPQVSVPIQLVNVRDPDEIPRSLQAGPGRTAILNVLTEERATIRHIVNGN